YDDGKTKEYGDGKDHGVVNIFKVQVPDTKKTLLEPVKYKDDDWKKVLRRYIRKWENNATIEEVWLAQEDFWVYRELLRALKDANTTVARFTPVEVKGVKLDAAAGEVARQRFENRYWQVDLALSITKDGKPMVSGKIKNIGDHRQNGGKLFFWVRIYK